MIAPIVLASVSVQRHSANLVVQLNRLKRLSRDCAYMTLLCKCHSILLLSTTMSLLPVLHQSWRSKSASIHPRRFPSNKVLLAGSPDALLHSPFFDDFSFPTLLLVDDGRPRSSVYERHHIIVACISLKANQPRRSGSRG